MRTLEPCDPAYPAALRTLPTPRPITLSGALPAGVPVAIVGTRRPTSEARAFAFELAGRVATAGGVVVSGGAVGVDAAAHEGALAAGGATICVVATGSAHVFPPEHRGLYDRIAASPGAMVWPFPTDAVARRPQFLRRNGVLVGLSHAVAVVQAGRGSGALNAAWWARKLGRPLWVVPQAPWSMGGFEGSLQELERGARPLTSTAHFLRSLELLPGATLPLPLGPLPRAVRAGGAAPVTAQEDLAPEHAGLLAHVDARPRHLEELAQAARTSIANATTALLTLTLQNVVEEGPLGFFSRAGK
ncbi:MAG TPA: DNA-processing protein DprA [Polyangiaceae bacterium]|nr:DNA-processing protein DprA [Polyangiaceae bacterium]